MRYTEIIEELSDYDPSVKAARVGSTVTIGEIVEMAKAADTIERLTKESDEFREERDMAMCELEPLVEQAERLQQALNEARAEIERLTAEHAIKLLRIESLGERS